MKLGYHPQIFQPQPNLWLTTVEKMWRMQWKGQTIGTLKETRCHSWKIVFKELDLVRFNLSSLMVLYDQIQKIYAHMTGRNIKDHYHRRSCHIFQALTYNFTLDSMACNMEGHMKLINRLSSPSDQLIHCISHLSEEQTSAELNLSCFICIQAHGFTVCNPHFCKKDSCSVKGPSYISTQK